QGKWDAKYNYDTCTSAFARTLRATLIVFCIPLPLVGAKENDHFYEGDQPRNPENKKQQIKNSPPLPQIKTMHTKSTEKEGKQGCCGFTFIASLSLGSATLRASCGGNMQHFWTANAFNHVIG